MTHPLGVTTSNKVSSRDFLNNMGELRSRLVRVLDKLHGEPAAMRRLLRSKSLRDCTIKDRVLLSGSNDVWYARVTFSGNDARTKFTPDEWVYVHSADGSALRVDIIRDGPGDDTTVEFRSVPSEFAARAKSHIETALIHIHTVQKYSASLNDELGINERVVFMLLNLIVEAIEEAHYRLLSSKARFLAEAMDQRAELDATLNEIQDIYGLKVHHSELSLTTDGLTKGLRIADDQTQLRVVGLDLETLIALRLPPGFSVKILGYNKPKDHTDILITYPPSLIKAHYPKIHIMNEGELVPAFLDPVYAEIDELGTLAHALRETLHKEGCQTINGDTVSVEGRGSTIATTKANLTGALQIAGAGVVLDKLVDKLQRQLTKHKLNASFLNAPLGRALVKVALPTLIMTALDAEAVQEHLPEALRQVTGAAQLAAGIDGMQTLMSFVLPTLAEVKGTLPTSTTQSVESLMTEVVSVSREV